MGGVDGGEGNRVGSMGGGEGGSRMVGDKEEKTGLLIELGGMSIRSGLDGDDVQDVGDVALVSPKGRTGGVGVSRRTQGARE